MINNGNNGSRLDPEAYTQISRRNVIDANSALTTGANGLVGRSPLQSYLGNSSPTSQVTGNSDTQDYLNGLDTPQSANFSEYSSSLLSDTLSGLEGIPYQFSEDVDRRIPYEENNNSVISSRVSNIGRKYADKIYSHMPIMFITPCVAQFMPDNDDGDRKVLLEALLTDEDKNSGFGELIQKQGRYYTPKFAYDEYYEYLDMMLNAVAYYLGLAEVTVKVSSDKYVKLGNATWKKDQNEDYGKRFFSSAEYLSFYLDSFTDVSHSFSNSYGDSLLAATINGFSDMANEVKFLFGSDGGIGKLIDFSSDTLTSALKTGIIGEAIDKIGGGVVSSLASNGINTILNGGKIIFPQVWQDSNYDESYSFNFKFRSPDHDSLSIFLNVLKPYCKLLALTMAHQDPSNPNGYTSPFICKASCPGRFNIDLGGITGLNVTAGAECQWNDDGLPTQIDVSLDITNLYSHLAISPYPNGGHVFSKDDIIHNTAYMDFLANMAGVNVGKMEPGRRIEMIKLLVENKFTQFPTRLGTGFSNWVSNVFGTLYNKL